MAVAQMNIRLSQQVKADGDAALALLGITPTEFVRSLWEKLALGGDSCREVVAPVLGLSETTDADAEMLSALARARTLYSDGMARLGINPDLVPTSSDDTYSDEEAYVAALTDRMAERGVW